MKRKFINFLRNLEKRKVKRQDKKFQKNFDVQKFVDYMAENLEDAKEVFGVKTLVEPYSEGQYKFLKKMFFVINEEGRKRDLPVKLELRDSDLKTYMKGKFYKYKCKEVKYIYIKTQSEILIEEACRFLDSTPNS